MLSSSPRPPRQTRDRLLASAAALSSVVALSTAPVAPAAANDADASRRGSCSGAADWKLRASPGDGRIEVEGEVDSNRNGQTWRWRILHNGHVSARGTATTHAPSGSFEVRRLLVNAAGVDGIGWRARNPASGQVCRGHLSF